MRLVSIHKSDHTFFPNGANATEGTASVNLTNDQEVLLTPAEVAKIFRVDPKTVTRWAKAGKITAIRTLGGHRRYRQSEIQSILKSQPEKGT